MIKRLFIIIDCGFLLLVAGVLGYVYAGLGRLSPTEEPGTMLLLGMFLLILGAAARRVFWSGTTPRGVSGRETGPGKDPFVPRTPPESVLVGGRDNQGDIRYMPQS